MNRSTSGDLNEQNVISASERRQWPATFPLHKSWDVRGISILSNGSRLRAGHCTLIRSGKEITPLNLWTSLRRPII